MRWIRERCAIVAALTAVAAGAAPAQDQGPELEAAPPGQMPLAVRAAAMAAGDDDAAARPEFPPFAEVSKGYQKVDTRPGGSRSLYTIWLDPKKQQLLAELHPGYANQRIFIASSIAGGSWQTGWQWRALYCYWTRLDNKLLLLEPQLLRRADGSGTRDEELKLAVARTYDDRVVTSAPIVAMGPGGGPVIDLDELLVGNSILFTGIKGNAPLARFGEIKAFPQNVEVPVTVPVGQGELTTLHYSISTIPSTGYLPREADERVGYFLTVFKDLTKMSPDGTSFVRYVNRWNLQKRDATLAKGPPVRPIVFYIEHTVPVRYRRWVREGILEWNRAFELVGLLNAIEVRQQDARTGEYMDLDPEDVRYNFFRWISSETPFAMGPSRVNPETGEILDADIILDDSMLKFYALAYQQRIAAYGLDGVDPAALQWMQAHPLWDPLVPTHPPSPARQRVLTDAALSDAQKAEILGLPRPDRCDGLLTDPVQQNRYCTYAAGKAMQMETAALAMRLVPGLFNEDGTPGASAGRAGGGDAPGLLDGVPEAYLGGVLREIVMHEVGHTLGLRHNFRASAWLSLQEYVSRTETANVGSVMDYNPVYVPAAAGEPRGEWVTPTIGPYDEWAIEQGYGFDEPKRQELFKKVSDPAYQYATDEDTWGPDPLVARFDLGSDPLAWAELRMQLVRAMRAKLLEKAVADGQSWHLLRQAYLVLLSEQLGAVRLAARYVGGVQVNRDRKGDPGGRDPLVPTDAASQRRALGFVLGNAMRDDAFDLRPEVLAKLASDKNRHWGNLDASDEALRVHDYVGQIQAFALLYLLNPGTLTRVYDNEARTAAGADALTLPEVMQAVVGEVYREILPDAAAAAPLPPAPAAFDNRNPMITSLRRGLQQMTTDRLVDLAVSLDVSPRPVQTLALSHLRRLKGEIETAVDRAGAGLDEYSRAHLADMHARITRALETVYVQAR